MLSLKYENVPLYAIRWYTFELAASRRSIPFRLSTMPKNGDCVGVVEHCSVCMVDIHIYSIVNVYGDMLYGANSSLLQVIICWVEMNS